MTLTPITKSTRERKRKSTYEKPRKRVTPKLLLKPKVSRPYGTAQMEIAFGVVGITSTAIHSINSLIQDINAVKDAPNVIADLKDELIAMEAVLVALNNARKNSQLENFTPDVKVALQLANTNCQKSCDKFRVKLRQWTKHSEDGLHWRDRFRVGLFAEGSVKALSAQLNCSKSTMNAAVSTAALYVFCLRVQTIIKHKKTNNLEGYRPQPCPLTR